MAYLWDLRSEDYRDFNSKQLPHVTPDISATNTDFTSDVSSVHWNSAGDRMITSASDKIARVWEINENDEMDIKNVKNFNVVLMNSKFNEQ